MLRSCWYARPAYAHWHGHANHKQHYESRSHRHGGSFGVRRPLRYLRYHLDLDDSQTRVVAAALNRLKLEREQARLDAQRSMHKLADLVAADTLLNEETKAALHEHEASSIRLREEWLSALRDISAALDADQREQFAELVRSGLFAP